MRVLLTGGHGFAGRHLRAELEAAGHEVIAPDHHDLDVSDRLAVAAAVADPAIDAVAHLAGLAFAPDAAADPGLALRVNVGGTLAVVEAIRARSTPPVLLVAGSSDVYAPPADGASLHEGSPLGPRGAYGLTKAAQESVALAAAARHGLAIIVSRAFNHAGRGQRRDFVVPAYAARVRAVVDGRATVIRAGNLDVRRDIGHVEDVVVAYRMLLEGVVAGSLPTGGLVVNVATGRSVAIRDVLDGFLRRAGLVAPVEVDPRLVRGDDPSEICGDASLLRRLTGWAPRRDLEAVLDDAWADAAVAAGAGIEDAAGPRQR